MEPSLPVDRRGNTSWTRHQSNASGGSSRSMNASGGLTSGTSKPSASQESKPHTTPRLGPAFAPLPSTSTMPLSLQQLSTSAASSTDSLATNPITSSRSGVVSPTQPSRHYGSPSGMSVFHHPEQRSSHVTQQHDQRSLAGIEHPRRPPASVNPGQDKPTSTGSSMYSYRVYDPSASRNSFSSARSTSSVNSLPPATESTLSTDTVMMGHGDTKGKARSVVNPALNNMTGKKKKVPTEIEEAVRNLGLAPPTTQSHIAQVRTKSPTFLSVPSTRGVSVSRDASTGTSAASVSDAASLAGTEASSAASISLSGRSAQSSKSTKSKPKKKKVVPSATVASPAASAAKPHTTTHTPAMFVLVDPQVKPKKKKRKPLPTSSGKPPGTSADSYGVPSSNNAATSTASPSLTTSSASPSLATSRPSAPARPAHSHTPSLVSPAQASIARPLVSPPPTSTPATRVTQRTPAGQTPLPSMPAASQSRNRHLDESAHLRTAPVMHLVSNSVVTSSHSGADVQSGPIPHASQASASDHVAEASPSASTMDSSTEPPPPPWSAPLTTITLQFTPIHAYLSAFHDPVETSTPASSQAQPTQQTAIPDSPPPSFRSQPPSTTEQGYSHTGRRDSRSSDTESAWPEIDLDAIEERSRGYASSENELDLLASQGKHTGTSTPPMQAANGDSMTNLRWQIRHWEAWRREGISIEERLQRLRQEAGNAEHLGESSIAHGNLATLRTNSTVESRDTLASGGQEASTAPARAFLSESISSAQSTNDTVRLAPLAEQAPSNRHSSPNRSDISPPSGSNLSNPRFPSMGTIRRARLQHFDARRQSTMSMSTVLQSSPTSTTLAPPRDTLQSLSEPDGLKPEQPQTMPAGDHEDREQVRLAMLQAALERRMEAQARQDPLRDPDVSQVQATPATGADLNTPTERDTDAALTATSDMSTTAPMPPVATSHVLARQLAAEVASRQPAPAIHTAQVSNQVDDSISLPSTMTPTADTVQSTQNSNECGQVQKKKKAAKIAQLQSPKAISRISRLFRTSTGPSSQSNGKLSSSESPSSASIVTPASPSLEPVMTLPKAPPRLTSDPLSTDNLRKLSRRQDRPPGVHASEDRSSSSSSGGNDLQASSSSPSEGTGLDSESDSADDESTKKPPSTVSAIHGRPLPPPLASTVLTRDVDREAAAASWRRTEDGRRHSALLSRPLSIKRKPPPVPPKRWGGIWDKDLVQDKLRRTFNLLEDVQEDGTPLDVGLDEGSSSDWQRNESTMLGSLSKRPSNDATWEVVAQDTADRGSPTPMWEVVGHSDSSWHDSRSANNAAALQTYSPPKPAEAVVPERPQEPIRRSLPAPPPPPQRFYSDVSDRGLANSFPNWSSHLTGESQQENIARTSSSADLSIGRGTSLRRSPAVRRPQSIVAMSQERENAVGPSPELPMSTPPSPEVRSRLNARPRHVYSASVPVVSPPVHFDSALPQVSRPRRPLPPIPTDLQDADGNTGESSHTILTPNTRDSSFPAVSHTRISHPAASVDTSSVQPREYTDLEVMLASMDSGGADEAILREVLGATQPATAAEIDSLPVGRVELERRRVDKRGKIKQKLSCVGIACNKCKICLQQFKEDELAVVLPLCLEVFHAEPCMRAYLATNNRCPSCHSALM